MEAGHAHIDTGDGTEGVMFDDHAEDGLADDGVATKEEAEALLRAMVEKALA